MCPNSSNFTVASKINSSSSACENQTNCLTLRHFRCVSYFFPGFWKLHRFSSVSGRIKPNLAIILPIKFWLSFKIWVRSNEFERGDVCTAIPVHCVFFLTKTHFSLTRNLIRMPFFLVYQRHSLTTFDCNQENSHQFFVRTSYVFRTKHL